MDTLPRRAGGLGAAGRIVEGDTVVVEPDGETPRFRKEAPVAVAS